MRILLIFLCLPLAACSSLPDNTELNTPFGSFEVSDTGEKAPPEPPGVRHAKERIDASRVASDDNKARLRDLEVCVSRVSFNALVDPCQCYFAHDIPAPRSCVAVPEGVKVVLEPVDVDVEEVGDEGEEQPSPPLNQLDVVSFHQPSCDTEFMATNPGWRCEDGDHVFDPDKKLEWVCVSGCFWQGAS